MVEVVFAGTETPGPVKETIHITTDLGEKFDATVTAYGTVLPAAEATPAVEPTGVTPRAIRVPSPLAAPPNKSPPSNSALAAGTSAGGLAAPRGVGPFAWHPMGRPTPRVSPRRSLH